MKKEEKERNFTAEDFGLTAAKKVEFKKRDKETGAEEIVEKKHVPITMSADESGKNYEKIMSEIKNYVSPTTVLKLTKIDIQKKIAELFKQYPTTRNVDFNNDWYGYQLLLILNLAKKIEKDRYIREHILDLEYILPSFREFNGLKQDLKAQIYGTKEEKQEENKESKKAKLPEILTKDKNEEKEIVAFGKMHRKKTIARKNSGKVPRRSKR
ncbi:MAG: hypothetical protein RR922_02935 [Clostridia bacterium]